MNAAAIFMEIFLKRSHETPEEEVKTACDVIQREIIEKLKASNTNAITKDDVLSSWALLPILSEEMKSLLLEFRAELANNDSIDKLPCSNKDWVFLCRCILYEERQKNCGQFKEDPQATIGGWTEVFSQIGDDDTTRASTKAGILAGKDEDKRMPIEIFNYSMLKKWLIKCYPTVSKTWMRIYYRSSDDPMGEKNLVDDDSTLRLALQKMKFEKTVMFLVEDDSLFCSE